MKQLWWAAALLASTACLLTPLFGETKTGSGGGSKGDAKGETVWCGFKGQTHAFPAGEHLIASGLTKEQAEALVEDDEAIGEAIEELFRELFGDNCSRCEILEGDPKPFGKQCTGFFFFETPDGGEVGVGVGMGEDPETGTYVVGIDVEAGGVAWIYCADDC